MEPLAKKSKLDDEINISDSNETCLPELPEKDNSNSKLEEITSACDNDAEITLPSPKVISQSISEKMAGITEFLGNHKGFFGTLKERWEDFLVNEISLSGKEIHLTTYDLPKTEDNENDTVADDALSDSTRTLLERIDKGESEMEKIEASTDKEERKNLHKAIKHFFPNVCSNTDSIEGTSYIVLRKNKAGQRDRRRSPRGGKFCQFVLYKEGSDSTAALNIVSRKVGADLNLFSTAGTKDRRAITSQLASIKGMDAARLKGINKHLRKIQLGNFEYTNVPLKLGSLLGNRFTLVIREAAATPEEVESSLEQLRTNGFINYFGMQRFGNCSVPTFEIGIALIKSDWKKAIDLILRPSAADFPHIRECKELFLKTGNASECANSLPPSIEQKLFNGIARHGKTLNAIEMLPRNLRLLYVHSFQSLLWNRVASRRIRELGRKPSLGDLTIKQGNIPVHEDSRNIRADLVTAENLESVTMSDVVIPLPGFDTHYPDSLYMPWYMEFLKEYDLDYSCFKHRVKDFCLSGSLRPVVVVPTDITYDLKHYTDPLQPLVLSDLQLLEQKQATVNDEGPNLAVILKMTLNKSVYATMAVREALKQVTVKQ